jgi:hypothetical protein
MSNIGLGRDWKKEVSLLFRVLPGNFSEGLRKAMKCSLTRVFLSADFRTCFLSNTKQFSQLLDFDAAILESCDKFRLSFTLILTQPLFDSHTHSTTHSLSQWLNLGVTRWRTALQCFIDIILPAALWLWSPLSRYKKWVPWVKAAGV